MSKRAVRFCDFYAAKGWSQSSFGCWDVKEVPHPQREGRSHPTRPLVSIAFRLLGCQRAARASGSSPTTSASQSPFGCWDVKEAPPKTPQRRRASPGLNRLSAVGRSKRPGSPRQHATHQTVSIAFRLLGCQRACHLSAQARPAAAGLNRLSAVGMSKSGGAHASDASQSPRVSIAFRLLGCQRARPRPPERPRQRDCLNRLSAVGMSKRKADVLDLVHDARESQSPFGCWDVKEPAPSPLWTPRWTVSIAFRLLECQRAALRGRGCNPIYGVSIAFRLLECQRGRMLRHKAMIQASQSPFGCWDVKEGPWTQYPRQMLFKSQLPFGCWDVKEEPSEEWYIMWDWPSQSPFGCWNVKEPGRVTDWKAFAAESQSRRGPNRTDQGAGVSIAFRLLDVKETSRAGVPHPLQEPDSIAFRLSRGNKTRLSHRASTTSATMSLNRLSAVGMSKRGKIAAITEPRTFPSQSPFGCEDVKESKGNTQ